MIEEKLFCSIHGEYINIRQEILGFEINVGCPLCAEEYEIAEEQKKNKIKEKEKIQRLATLNIEPMYYESTLKNFQVFSNEQKRALSYAENIVKNKEGKLVLLGMHGAGKTHLAIGVVRELGGALFSMYEITTRIRSSYVSGAKETELDIVNELSRLPMLAIDEIGRTKGSEAEINWLSYIIDKRHTRNLPLILISNKHARKHCKDKGCNNCLENYISEDIMSRLAEDGHLVNMADSDYRRVKRKKIIDNKL